MKTILLDVGRDKPLTASVGTDANDPAVWMHNARECAWDTCKHYGNSPVTVLDPDDNNAPVLRVQCEWLEADEDTHNEETK